ncbi:MAG: hypothetical protein ACKVKM_01550 [Verrucomicrobiia bacterium]|jgi:hypothetical protein|tara:strand:+ start:1832 stop:2095 length:264 start_codon:yes stop_codon:yes gene_type:complete
MKFLSISAALLALLSLVGFAINWSLINIDSLESRWEENWHQSLSELTWIMNDAGAGLAILLLAIGMAMQAFKKPKTDSPPMLPDTNS